MREMREMLKTNGKIHHAWFILLVCLGIMGGLVGILLNCTGIIFTEIIKEFGFRTGDLSIYYSIRSMVRALALGAVSGMFFKKKSKRVLIGITAITCIAYMSMGLYTQLWQWYISAVFIGIGTSYTGMAISVLLANWFATKKGLVMGLAMSASGVLGAVVSPMCSTLIESIGWRGACVAMGLLTMVALSNTDPVNSMAPPKTQCFLPLLSVMIRLACDASSPVSFATSAEASS